MQMSCLPPVQTGLSFFGVNEASTCTKGEPDNAVWLVEIVAGGINPGLTAQRYAL